MALTLAASTTDRVTVAAGASTNNLPAGTIMMWCYPTTVGNNYYELAGKYDDGSLGWNFSHFSSLVRMRVRRATTHHQASSNADLTVNAWNFVATHWDVASGNPALFFGSLSALAADVSTSAQAGSGTQNDDSGQNLAIGNLAGGQAYAFRGRIAVWAIFNRKLTQAEIQSWQFHPRMMDGCVGYYQLGWNGTGTQPDWSGSGNAGTVTGATVGDHVPLRPLFGASRSYPMPVVVPPAAGWGHLLASSRSRLVAA